MKNYSFIKHYYYQKNDLCLKFGSKLTNQVCLFALGEIYIKTLKKNDKIFFRVDMVLLFYTMFSLVPAYAKSFYNTNEDKTKEGYQLQISFKKLDVYKLMWYLFCENNSKINLSVKMLKNYEFFDFLLVNLTKTFAGSAIDYAHIISYRNIVRCNFSLLLRVIKNDLVKKNKSLIDFIKHILYLWEL